MTAVQQPPRHSAPTGSAPTDRHPSGPILVAPGRRRAADIDGDAPTVPISRAALAAARPGLPVAPVPAAMAQQPAMAQPAAMAQPPAMAPPPAPMPVPAGPAPAPWAAPHAPQQAAPAPRRRRRWPWVVGGIALLLVIIAMAGGGHAPAPTTSASPAPSAASAPSSAPVAEPSTAPAGPATSFGDGTHVVGQDIEPGTYRTAGPATGSFGTCYWSRLRNTSGELDGIIANGLPTGPATVTIRSGDAAFETTGCQTWIKTN